MGSAETELQDTIELRATAIEIADPKPDLDDRAKKRRFEACFKRMFKKKIASACLAISSKDEIAPLLC